MAKKKAQPEEMLMPEEVVTPAYEVENEPDRLSPVEALIGVVIRPRATFERMRDAARGHWWVVAVLAVLALILLSIATVPIEAEAARSALQAQKENTKNSSSEMSDEQQAQVEQVQSQMQDIITSQAVLGGLNVAFGIVGLAISYLVRAGFAFLLGLALGGRATFRQIWRMAVWTTLPDVLRTLVSAMMTFANGSSNAPGLSYMLTSEEIKALPYLATLLRSIDIYLVWSLVLLAIGVYVTSQLSRGKSALVALAYWLFVLAFALGGTAIGQAMAGMAGVG